MDNFPRKNLTAKVLAIVFAVTLWVYVMNEQNPPIDANFQIPLEVRNAADGYVVQEVAETVRIKVRGPRSVIAGSTVQDVKSYLDLGGVAEGRQTVKVHAVAPNGLDVLEIFPDKVTLYIDKIVSRQIPIELAFSGTSADGANVGKAFPAISQVTIEGPRTITDTVARIVATIDLTGKSGDFSAEIEVTPLDRAGKTVEGVTIKPAKVGITTSLLNGPNRKLVDIRTLVTGELPAGTALKSIITEPDQIEIYGEPKTLEQLEFVYTEPISLDGFSKDGKKDVKLQLQPGITAAQNTVTAHISVENKPQE
ncbi:hypothetical protein HSX37_07305|uniref:YbbR domain-containing protein n=1 Tax=Dendrosporobacter quercicolus TaxID=146817 RepID=A0A1G9VCM3_9FIRM|nr:CdaR family protein [Dendrosporobacter quercicolus]NSL47852.1 hypothetical protein [Dendrosporobacter quercicolus DSM 1736]SDM69861.1 YbbR domain-containing protein [Dendrosporobacter quercicolus]